MSKKPTLEEYDKYMFERNQKIVQDKPKDEIGFLIGSPNDIVFPTPNIAVKCDRCGKSLYVRPANKELAEKNNLKIVCILCAVEINPTMVKGALVQAGAAAAQKFGGKP
jgi:hypothetical protein